MSLLFREQRASDGPSIPSRVGWRKSSSRRGALSQSVGWACIRLRSDLISTLPVDTYTKTAAGQAEVPTPPVLVAPGGEEVNILEWLYSSQSELDTVGNSFGLITERDAAKLPRRIDLVARQDVRVQSSKGEVTFWVNNKKVDRENLWHERQFTASGVAVGMSPLYEAALALQQHSAAQEFAAAWFGGGLVPLGHLKYSEAKVPAAEAEAIKLRHKLSIENGDPMVTGKDWEYTPIAAATAQANFIAAMQFADIEMCRFYGVPGDLVDANVSGASITYANITQRNLQFLIMNLGPAITRREKALSKLMQAPRFVKLNSDALLRMDPETVAKMLGQQVRDRIAAPSEARTLLNRHPYTDEQIAEFAQLFPVQYPSQTAPADRAGYTIGAIE
ncbi:phage portal protein [Microbacterium saperdae]